VIAKVNETVPNHSYYIENWSNTEADSESFRVHKMSRCEIHNGIYEKGNLYRQIGVGLWQTVNLSYFTRYRNDGIVGQVINGKGDTY